MFGIDALVFSIILVLVMFAWLMWLQREAKEPSVASAPASYRPSISVFSQTPAQFSVREQANREDQEMLAAIFIEKRKAKQREELRKEFIELMQD